MFRFGVLTLTFRLGWLFFLFLILEITIPSNANTAIAMIRYVAMVCWARTVIFKKIVFLISFPSKNAMTLTGTENVEVLGFMQFVVTVFEQ